MISLSTRRIRVIDFSFLQYFIILPTNDFFCFFFIFSSPRIPEDFTGMLHLFCCKRSIVLIFVVVAGSLSIKTA